MFQEFKERVLEAETISYIGKIERVVGMSLEARGLVGNIGDIVVIYNENDRRHIEAEVVGFSGDVVQLMAYEDISGIGVNSFVRNTGKRLRIPVGKFLKGRIIDAMGNPMDGKETLDWKTSYSVENKKTNPLDRPPIRSRLHFGVKAIDTLNTIGLGQRVGIFAGSGVGKSTLLGMIARNTVADINVIALVGERGREVREFVEKDLGEEGMKRSILVVATSDQPAMLRAKCPLVATTIAEYFKDQGCNVLLMMDSLTRFAMAQREIGLATGEPAIARGYTPSIYAEFPKLLERSGKFKRGSITGIYTVLVEGDDTNEPISDTVRGILDGHIVLSRKLAHQNHFPAIDISSSISRLMNDIVDEESKVLAGKLRSLLSIYEKNEDLVSIGAYQKGSNRNLDEALRKIDQINAFLMQGMDEVFTREQMIQDLTRIFEN